MGTRGMFEKREKRYVKEKNPAATGLARKKIKSKGGA